MDEFFENHLDQVNLITQRSQKDKKQTFSRLQKASMYKLCLINGEIDQEFIKSFEGINVHQITQDGKALFASSDKTYLPDLTTRLYQNLENICKSYKSHKVHSNNFKPESAGKDSKNVVNIDLSNWNNNYLKNIAKEIYAKLSKAVKDNFVVYINIEGLWGLWQITSPKGICSKFDEINTFINYRAEDKHTGNLVLNKTISITPNDIRRQSFEINKIISDIEKLQNFNSKKISYEKLNIRPTTLVFDEDLTSEMLIKIYQTNTSKNIYKINKFVDTANDYCISEQYDKFGNMTNLNSKSTSKKHVNVRQSFFYETPRFVHRNLEFCKCDDLSNIFQDEPEKFIKSLGKKLKTSSILYLYGSKENNHYLQNTYHTSIVLNPANALYFDGKNINYIDLEYIEIPEINDIRLIKGNIHRIMELPSINIKMGLSGFAYSILNKPKKITLI